jgi:hypothetical protein
MKRGRWILVFLLLLIPLPVVAQSGGQIEVDPADSPLVISGQLGEGGSLTGDVRLTAVGGDVEEFLFLPSDLQLENGDATINRRQISLVGAPSLTEGVPENFQVAVNPPPVPGTYRGQVEFLLPGQPQEEALVLPLTVVALTESSLTPLPGTNPVRLRLVRCAGGLDCGLAGLLLPESAFVDRRSLHFDNPSQGTVTITGAEVVVLGEQTDYQLGEAALELPELPLTLPAEPVLSIPLALTRDAMPPDRYTGSIYLTLEGAQEPVNVLVDMSVRSGPVAPLLLLLLGIVLGRLFKYMQERGGPQAEKLQEVNRLDARVQSLHSDDQKILEPMLEGVRRLVYREDLSAVEGKLGVIEARLEILEELRQIEEQDLEEDHPKREEALQKIEQARGSVRRGQDARAQELLGELQRILMETGLMRPKSPGGQPLSRAAGRAEIAERAAGRAVAGPRVPLAPPEPSRWEWVKDTLIFLSGVSEQVRAEAALWLVQPLLYLALIVGLIVIGLNTFYVENGATFGASPLADGIGLVLWGLSADVAGRSLSNLQGGG